MWQGRSTHAISFTADKTRWQYELTRRGGLLSGKRIKLNAVEGYSQSLRSQNLAEVKNAIEERRTNMGEIFGDKPKRVKWCTHQGWIGERLMAALATPRGGKSNAPIRKGRLPPSSFEQKVDEHPDLSWGVAQSNDGKNGREITTTSRSQDCLNQFTAGEKRDMGRVRDS